jgi:hypothetical protein
MALVPLRFLAALGFASAVGSVAAQALQAPESAAVACMTPPPELRPKIVYPVEVFERREGGTVTVEMDFVAPDRPPRYSIERDFGAVGRAFAAAIHDHVMALRVPCLTVPVRLTQDFVFVPNDGRKVTWTRAVQPAAPGAARQLGCVTRPSAAPLEVTPSVWGGLTRSAVLLELTFTAAAEPPLVKVLAPSPAAGLTREAVERSLAMRNPCADGQPLRAEQLWIFRQPGAPRSVLKNAGLAAFLGSVKDLDRLQVFFDFNTMGCPFDVALSLRQPHGRNYVGEIGPAQSARRPFLDWLASLSLDLTPRQLTEVLGESMTISVPCGTLDL